MGLEKPYYNEMLNMEGDGAQENKIIKKRKREIPRETVIDIKNKTG
jgi:hypothetical protein